MRSKHIQISSFEPNEAQDRIRINLDLPRTLLEQCSAAIEKDAARNRNSLIVEAIEAYLRMLENQWIDEEFAQMADDKRYQSLSLKVAEEFAASDWEALRIRDES
jgi:metal-responsive CopG/Arc/MetJ family transcriptional regulator